MGKKLLYSIAIGVLVSFVFTALFLGDTFRLWHLRITDTYFLPSTPTTPVLIIGIDDRSLAEIGRWPWDRSVHAQLLEQLGDNPAVIGYDIAFPEESTATDDARLAAAFSSSPPVILPSEARSIDILADRVVTDSILRSIPSFTSVTTEGIVNTIADDDSVTRSIPVRMVSGDGQQQNHFSQQIANTYREVMGEAPIDVHQIPADNGLMRVNFTGPPQTFPVYSFSDVISGDIPPETFRDAIVLVGATAPNLKDSQITPVSFGQPMNGVEIHANAVQTILSGSYLVEESDTDTIVGITTLGIGGSLLLGATGLILGTILHMIIAIGYVIYAFVSFDLGVIRNLLFPLVVLLAVYIGQIIYKYFIEYYQRRFLRRAFSYYVPNSVLEQIINKPEQLKLGGETREMTVLFSDIVGFTSITEDLTPEETSRMLNLFLTKATNIIFRNRGVVDKFVGDAIIAFWNAPIKNPSHALNACNTALEMVQELTTLHDDFAKLGVSSFSIRIGISTGNMLVGNMGSEMRFNYTVLGDRVNLGSRLEQINKQYGTGILISDETHALIHSHMITRKVDTVVVKGKKKGVSIYELRGTGKPDNHEQRLIEQYEEAFAAYQKGSFSEAITLCERLLEDHPHDGPTLTLLKRAKQLAAHPPTHWDGVYVAMEK
jgi:adenylate cyclase